MRILLFLLLTCVSCLSQNVTLTWNQSVLDYGVVGYKIYYRLSSSSQYNGYVFTTNNIGTVTNLAAGKTYYFSVVSSSIFGFDSPFSSEVNYIVPKKRGRLASILQSSESIQGNWQTITNLPEMDISLESNQKVYRLCLNEDLEYQGSNKKFQANLQYKDSLDIINWETHSLYKNIDLPEFEPGKFYRTLISIEQIQL